MAESLDGLSKDQLEEYQEIFAMFDSDEKGYITLVKLGEVMRYFGWDPSETILQVYRVEIFILSTLSFDIFIR